MSIDFYVKIRDGAQLIVDACQEQLEKMEPKESKKPTLDEINSLKYLDKTSEKGSYKTADKTDNPNNPAFLKLQKYLKDHNGFAILHGFKFWVFSNNPDIIGRRKK